MLADAWNAVQPLTIANCFKHAGFYNSEEPMTDNPPGNVDVIYDSSRLTRGHSSHICVGCIIEMYTGIVIDHIVMPNCTSGPKENKDTLTGSSSMLHCARKTQIVRLTRWKWPRA